MSAPRKFCVKCGWQMGAGTVCPGCEHDHAPSAIHDVRRDAILSRAVATRPVEVRVTTITLHALFRLAASETGRMAVKDLNHSMGAKSRITLEDVEPLIARGWIARGTHQVMEMTDAGNALVRELVAFANGKGGRP